MSQNLENKLDRSLKMIIQLSNFIVDFKEQLIVKLDLFIHEIEEKQQILQNNLEEFKKSENHLGQYFESIFKNIQQKFQEFTNDYSNIEFQYILWSEKQAKKIEHHQQFNFELIDQSSLGEEVQCQVFAFNQNNSTLLVGKGKEIVIYQFSNGIMKEIQRLNKHQKPIDSLQFLNNENSFISGGDLFIIWYQQLNQWIGQHLMNSNSVQNLHCILVNKNNEILISDCINPFKSILRLWVQKVGSFSLQQTLLLNKKVVDMSLNEMQDLCIISCDNQQTRYIQICQFKNHDYQWSKFQKIQLNESAQRLCFTIKNQFIVLQQSFLEVFDFNQNNQIFERQQKVSLSAYDACWNYFPCQYFGSQKILFLKHGKFLSIIQIQDNGKYQIVLTIQFNHHILFGRITNDCKYLVTWDQFSNQIQVRKLSLKNDLI